MLITDKDDLALLAGVLFEAQTGHGHPSSLMRAFALHRRLLKEHPDCSGPRHEIHGSDPQELDWLRERVDDMQGQVESQRDEIIELRDRAQSAEESLAKVREASRGT